jgi:hypothetical protein
MSALAPTAASSTRKMRASTRASERHARRRDGREREDCQRCRRQFLRLRHLSHLPSL